MATVDSPFAVHDYSTVLQFKLTVVDSSPEAFRRVLVPDFTLESFHYVISYAFEWVDGFEPWGFAFTRTHRESDSVDTCHVMRYRHDQVVR